LTYITRYGRYLDIKKAPFVAFQASVINVEGGTPGFMISVMEMSPL
jgi:hypothetical protein